MQLPASKNPGVYMIVNTVNGKKYVGSAAKSLRQRAKNHRVELRAGNHPNVHLQRAWKKYGEPSFAFVILEECDAELCIGLEQKWMDQLDCYKTGYNRCPTAGSRLGTKMSDETKEKIGSKKRGIPLSEETRAKMSASQKIAKKFTSGTTRSRLKANHWSKGPNAKSVLARIVAGRIQTMAVKRAEYEANKPLTTRQKLAAGLFR